MSLHKLTAPGDDVVTFIGSENKPFRRTWIVLGVGYTSDPAVIQYAREAGYAVTDAATIPESHATKVGRLESYPIQRSSYGQADGADPEAKFRFIHTDGRTIDVCDISKGTITR